MNRTLKISLSAALFTLLAGAGLAFAGPGHGPHGPGHEPPPEVVKEFDKNADGKLDETERKAAREAMRARMEAHHKQILAQFDTNRDGKLDDAERAKMLEQKATESFRKADKNNDGVLSLDEFQAMVREHHAEGGPMFGKFGKQGRRALRRMR